MVRREELERVGPFDVELKTMEDWEMWIRLNQRGAPAWVPRPLLAKREHSRMMSLDVPAMFESISSIERLTGATADRGVFHRWIAELCLRNGHRGRALGHFAVAAIRGQASGVAADVRTILRRRLAQARSGAAVPAPEHPEWIEQGRRWVDDLRRSEG
jgi:hypothetical protein